MGLGSVTTSLDRIFSEGINEVIVTTFKNAAPMGIIMKNGSLSMIVFCTSHTARNIVRDGWIVAHISHDPVLLVKTAFEDLPEKYFIIENIGDRTVYRLNGIQNWIACTAYVENKTSDRIFVKLEPVHVNITSILPVPVHRGLNNIIEATVHATRFIVNKDPWLANLIRHHGDLVMRCGGEQDKKAIKLLYSYINEVVPETFL